MTKSLQSPNSEAVHLTGRVDQTTGRLVLGSLGGFARQSSQGLLRFRKDVFRSLYRIHIGILQRKFAATKGNSWIWRKQIEPTGLAFDSHPRRSLCEPSARR